MNAFVNGAMQVPDSRTENGAMTFASSLDAHVDLFFRVGASRGKINEIMPLFRRALAEDAKLAVRIALWTRDARGGSGERAMFRAMLKEMPTDIQKSLVYVITELGRWDDLGVLVESPNEEVSQIAAEFWKQAVLCGAGLAAKWAPRKGDLAVKLRNLWGMTPKQYRKTIVSATNVVETQMCSKQWNEINFEHVPSVAAARYNSAFKRNATAAYAKYKDALVNGEAKINAAAVFPHDIVRTVKNHGTDKDVADAQWNSLPDYCEGKASNILVMSDVSGSMETAVAGSITAMDVSVALGLYISERQPGPFKDLVLTFSDRPAFHKVQGKGIAARIGNLSRADWGGSTNIEAALAEILKVAVNNKVSADDMPTMLVILSDMEFNYCTNGKTAFQTAERQYATHGYAMPRVVFWNLNSRTANFPVRQHQSGAALVSGFSPAILKTILSANIDNFTPKSIMLNAVMSQRYSVPGVTA